MINSWPGPANSWEGVDAYFTWADSPGMLVLITLVSAAILLGAEGVQMGTAFLLCPESNCGDLHKAAIRNSSSSDTHITYGFSGRPARAIQNKFTIAMEGKEKKLNKQI